MKNPPKRVWILPRMLSGLSLFCLMRFRAIFWMLLFGTMKLNCQSLIFTFRESL
jgi:hypothetical protein